MDLKLLRHVSYILILLLLVVSVAYHYITIAKPLLPTSGFIENPQLYDGLTRAVLGIYAGPSPEGFILQYNQRLIPVQYQEEVRPPRYGQILIYGTFHREGYIEAQQVHNYNYNYIIYFISFLTFLFVLALFFSEWKISTGGIESA